MTATSGRRLSALCMKSGPLGSLARMLLESSRWFSPARRLKWEAAPLFSTRITYTERSSSTSSKPSAKTSSVKDIPSSRLLFRLVPSERPTEGTGCGLSQGGLLPTPRATEIVEDPVRFVKRLGDRTMNCVPNLSSMAVFRPWLLPTPMSTDIHHADRVKELKEAGVDTFHSRKNGETRPNGLTDFLDFHGMLLTPSASDGMRANFTMESLKRHNKKNAENSNLSEQIAHKVNGGTSQLNPLFVTEMMGFPLDWLVSPFQSGGQNPSKP